jgi:hypothetical protein
MYQPYPPEHPTPIPPQQREPEQKQVYSSVENNYQCSPSPPPPPQRLMEQEQNQLPMQSLSFSSSIGE